MGLHGVLPNPSITAKKILDVDCLFEIKDLAEWCVRMWDEKIRGKLVLKKQGYHMSFMHMLC